MAFLLTEAHGSLHLRGSHSHGYDHSHTLFPLLAKVFKVLYPQTCSIHAEFSK